MKKFLIVFVLAALGYFAFSLGSADDDVPASVRSVMPESVVWYAEAQDLSQVWSEIGKTEAWQDLENSAMLSAVLQEEFTQTLLARLQEVSEQVDYPLNESNLMKFVGKEFALGATIPEGGHKVELLLATRLDTDALMQDFLLGDADWFALQEELERRSGAAELETSSTEVEGGYVITTLTQPGETDFALHAVLLEDVLCLATTRELALQAVATRLGLDSPSLADSPSFKREVAALSPGHFAFDWIDFDALDERRADLVQMLEDNSHQAELSGLIHGVLDGVKDCPALARSWSLPEHDLYQVTWDYSRTSAEIFGDMDALPVGDYVVPNAMFVMESSNLGGLAAEVRGSSAWSMAAESEGIQILMDFIDEAWISAVLPQEGDKSSTHKGSSRFERKMIERVAGRQLEALFDGDMHFSGTAVEGEELEGEFMTAIRLGTDGLFVAHALMTSYAMETELEFADWSGQKVLVLPPDGETEVAMTLQGNTLLVGTVSQLKEVLTRTSVPANDQVTKIRDRFEPGHYAFGYLDVRQALDIEELKQGMPPEMLGMLDNFVGPFYAGALYATPGLEAVEFQMLAGIPEALDLAVPQRTEPPALSQALPETTIGSATGLADMVASLDMLKGILVGEGEMLPQEDYDLVMQEISDFIGVDFENELLPVLGPELGYALVFSDEPRDAVGGAPIPGIILALEVRDEALVQRVLDNLFDAGNTAFEEAEFPMRLADHGGLIILESDEEALPIQPAVGFVGGLLVVVSDVSVIETMEAVKQGSEAGMEATPIYQRAIELSDPRGAENWAFVDFTRLLAQISEYKELLSAVAPSSAPFPEYPEDGDEEEWARRMNAWEAQRAEDGKKLSKNVDGAFTTLDVLQFISMTQKREDGAMRSRLILGLVK